MDNSVDKQWGYFHCVSFIFHPQPPVYDISRAIPEDFRVFPQFPQVLLRILYPIFLFCVIFLAAGNTC